MSRAHFLLKFQAVSNQNPTFAWTQKFSEMLRIPLVIAQYIFDFQDKFLTKIAHNFYRSGEKIRRFKIMSL